MKFIRMMSCAAAVLARRLPPFALCGDERDGGIGDDLAGGHDAATIPRRSRRERLLVGPAPFWMKGS